MIIFYPAILSKEGKCFDIDFPDFPEIKISAKNSNDAIALANQHLEKYIIHLMISKKEIPIPTAIEDIKTTSDSAIILAQTDIPEITEKCVNRTLTIPEWVNDLAVKNNINFSQLLTTALLEKMGIFIVPEKKERM